MIKDFELTHFGPLESVSATNLGKINLFIGPNSCGKTFLLKALYSIIRSQEETGRGNDPRDFGEVLSDKLFWTFQADKLGDIVQRGTGNRLKASVTMDNRCGVAFEFGQDTSKKVSLHYNNLLKREANSIFLPPKEVLSLNKLILRTALQDKAFGFDATYVDLILALQNPTQKGKNFGAFKKSRENLEHMFDGRVEFDQSQDKWVYRRGNSRFSVNTTAEGIKKIAILDTLLGNRYLSPDSVIFIDEPESALHPTAITQFLDIIQILAEQGIQFFITSHSYFVIKKLYLLGLQHNAQNRPVFVADNQGNWHQSNLVDGIPDNEIVNESIRLFDQELEVSM